MAEADRKAESGSTKVGHTLAKIFGIHLEDPNVDYEDKLTRGESAFSLQTDDTDGFYEPEPTTGEWIRSVIPTKKDTFQYFYGLVPFLHWIGHYNVQWLIGDLVAGITVGAVVVPQGMAYATLADLPVQFGLYSSFMGTLIYWIFATSKDITIGPVAVASTITGNILIPLLKKHPELDGQGHIVASSLALLAGIIITAFGLFRIGWIVDFIPLSAITAFMTGSALNIGIGQIPTLFGISSHFNTRAPTYWVIINTLKNLHLSTLDAAIGLTALVLLYGIREAARFGTKRFPRQQKVFFYITTLRTIFVILLYTLIGWLAERHHKKKPTFKILGTVPRGFQNIAVPTLNKPLIKDYASKLPVTVIVLLIEHIAISKSFGRVNNYTINPSQELLAIGITNIFGPFFGAYPSTGSFSRTAIKSKAGVRTPLAGVITSIIVLIAIYALTAVFFYIPSAALSAVIIHAVFDLITPLNTVYRFWRVSPIEVIIHVAGVIITVLSSIENGIYTTICVSAAVLGFRIVKARGRFLGRAKIHSVIGDHHFDSSTGKSDGANDSSRDVYLPLDHHDGSNPGIELERPAPGVFIYRFSEGFNYPNANHYFDYLLHVVFKETQRTNLNTYARLGDRPWNDPAPRKIAGNPADTRPHLKAIILDFAAVNNVDTTSVQVLIDVRNQLDRYTTPDIVEWHFANIKNRWTKRALVSAGFGYPINSHPIIKDGETASSRWKPIFDVAAIGGTTSAAADAERREQEAERKRQSVSEKRDVEELNIDTSKQVQNSSRAGRFAAVGSINRPFFHADLNSAVQSVLENLHLKQETISEAPVIGKTESLDS
jgi:sodium-independent sulfate anion transporter 11